MAERGGLPWYQMWREFSRSEKTLDLFAQLCMPRGLEVTVCHFPTGAFKMSGRSSRATPAGLHSVRCQQPSARPIAAEPAFEQEAIFARFDKLWGQN